MAVIILFTPGPVRWKLWMFDLSLTVIAYLPGLSVVTFAEPFLRLIVKPGPTLPVSLVGPMAPTGAASASTATTRAATSAIRDIILLLRSLASCAYFLYPNDLDFPKRLGYGCVKPQSWSQKRPI